MSSSRSRVSRFYVDATPQNPTEKRAVYLRGIRTPLWVASNPDIARFAAKRLNDRDASGHLRGWDDYIKMPDGSLVFQRGFTVDDLIGAAKGGELSREALAAASTLIKAIAVVANAKDKGPL